MFSGKDIWATRFGHEWEILADVERPTDGRVTLVNTVTGGKKIVRVI